MAEAEVGDDVFGDDPTVIALEARVAKLLGKEAGLFVPTGSMGNQICINVHTSPGDEILIDVMSHAINYEAGGPSRLSGVQPKQLQTIDGFPTPEQVKDNISPRNLHFAPTTLLVLENTHNLRSGKVLSLERYRALRDAAKETGLKLHIDGARLWNAHVATGASLADLTDGADSVSVCFSKGLGAPVGSMVVGTKDFIWEARRVRKVLGGGMRQVGVLAAAANCALDESLPLLKHDHARAKQLAAVLAETRFLSCDPATIETNIVRGEIGAGCPFADAPAAMAGLAEHKVRCVAMGKKAMRFVLHRDVDDEDVARASEVFRKIAKR
jgi:threonine aldolase